MNSEHVPISFYVPENPHPDKGFPSNIDEYWRWVCEVEKVIKWDGRFSWTLQTYLQLKSLDIKVDIVEKLPEDGIVIAHRDFLPDSVGPNEKRVLVVLKPDRRPHPFAQIHVVQSVTDPLLEKADTEYWHNVIMPLWPQPDLVPRSPQRDAIVSRVCYLGRIEHLAIELRSESWSQYLKQELALDWEIRSLSRWHDYNDVDVVAAVRGFGDELAEALGTTDDIRMKPASKLSNCWLAGVPAILSPEPSYQQLKRSDLDFIAVHSVNEVLSALTRLKQDCKLWEAMVKNGKKRGKAFSAESLKLLWKEFLLEKCMSVYRLWQSASYRRHYFKCRQSRMDINTSADRPYLKHACAGAE